MTADKALDKNTKQCINTLWTIRRFILPSGKNPTAAVHIVNQITYINGYISMEVIVVKKIQYKMMHQNHAII